MGYKVGDRVRFLAPAFLKGVEARIDIVDDDNILVEFDTKQQFHGLIMKYRMLVSGSIDQEIEPITPPIQVGDFVYVQTGLFRGEYGKAIRREGGSIAVEFARYSIDRHDCDELTKKGHGYWYTLHQLELVNDRT